MIEQAAYGPTYVEGREWQQFKAAKQSRTYNYTDVVRCKCVALQFLADF